MPRSLSLVSGGGRGNGRGVSAHYAHPRWALDDKDDTGPRTIANHAVAAVRPLAEPHASVTCPPLRTDLGRGYDIECRVACMRRSTRR